MRRLTKKLSSVKLNGMLIVCVLIKIIFSYHRCNTSFEAEDLCSDIILAVISAIHKQERIENFYAFVWTIARRVYADYCKDRNAERQVDKLKVG